MNFNMKKIILILLMFISAKCFSQRDNDFGQKNTFRDTVYFKVVPYNGGAGMQILVRDSVVTSPTFGKLFTKVIPVLDTANKWVNSISRVAGKDSIIFYIGGTRFAIKDSTGGKPSLNKGVFVASPTSIDTIDVWQTPVAITITSLKAILRGSSPSVTYNIGFGTNIQSPTAVFTADITCTSITTGCSNSSGFNDATIPAGSFIWVYTTAASGTIRSIAFTINYTED